MTVVAVLICNPMEQPSEHEVDTRSGEATCTVCTDTHVLDSAELDTLLEDA